MKQRLNYYEKAPKLGQGLAELAQVVRKGVLGNTILDLVNMRASQINGCTLCIDMHAKEAKIHGERELRLYHIPGWRESSLFTEKERAALEWTEALTQVTNKGIEDVLYDSVKKHFTDQEMAELTFAIGFINVWNRMNAAFRTPHGAMDKAFGLDKAGLN